MHSSISGSDRAFLSSLFIAALILSSVFFLYSESFSEAMLMEKTSGRVESLRVESARSGFALLGTSHATSHSMPAGVHYVNLTGGHNLPPAMYYEAKALLKNPTSIKVAYIEADDHIFMNGDAYRVKLSSENDAGVSVMYDTWSDFFDEDGKFNFGGSSRNGGTITSLSLQQDIKPILLKRIARKAYQAAFVENRSGKEVSLDVCQEKPAISEPITANETYWSRLRGEERQRELRGRLGWFALENPSPLSPLMTEYYEKMINLFLDHGIPVVLVRFPMSEDFQKGVHSENTAAINKYIAGLQEKTGIQMLDISYLSKYGDRFFENEDHVHKDFFPLIGALIIDDFCNKRRGN